MSHPRTSHDCQNQAKDSREKSPSGFRVPGLSSPEDSSGSSSDDGAHHGSGDTPWRRRRKRHRPSGYTPQTESSTTAAMETEHAGRSHSETVRRAPNAVWAAVLADSVLDDAMSAHMRVYRSDRSVEAYAYPQMSARRRVALAYEEGELSEDEEDGDGEEEEDEVEEGEVEEKDDEDDEVGEDSHSDSLSIDNNVDPGEFAREGPRGRFDMEDVEAMDTNSRSALPCSSTSVVGPAGDAEPQASASRKRPRRKKPSGRRTPTRARLGKRSFDPDKARPPFELEADRSDEAIAAAMASRLLESRSDLLLRCVKLLGREKSYHLMLLTEDIEEAGGLYTADGSRRRTTGGVFFHILREDDEITADKKRLIFAPTEEELEYRKEKKKRKRISASRRLQQRHASGSGSVSGSRPPLDEWASSAPPFLPGLPGLTPPHASTTSSSPPSSTLASAEAASSGKTPNNSPRPAPLEVDDF